ncbi:SulP family inorganic anion transporter [Halalkalibacter urbisdiaboli]|uniref:SulP family inorganic anion transporter n=1 Tax=Halalkalibacter urbisdiaboli TaxID=1960589 RepID=UPI000B44F7E3|nr:solute carrier family 26 protein [Halalkalibacter urbisdiaboli]
MIPNSLMNHTKATLKRDMIAGITLFVMLIPQGMAYAMLAGLPPVMGLYASTIPLFVYAFLGSSKHLSVGPVAITSLLVFSGVSVYAEPGSASYISTVIVLAMMVGSIQVLFGILRLGFIVKFIPHSVMNGYTSAAAIVIGISQLKHLLGIELGNYLQVHLLLLEVFQKVYDIHLLTLLIGVGCIALLLAMKRWNPKLPAALVVVILSIATVLLFRLDTQQLRVVGDIPNGFPGFSLPYVTFEMLKMLAPLALTIALLGYMESLSIAKAVAKKEKYDIKPNKEFTALGFSNIIGSFFSSYPVNGSFSRTAVNHQAGGATQLTAMITGLLVTITVAIFTSFFYYLPNATLAAIIMVAVYKLVDFKEMKHLFIVKQFEGWIWLATFFTTLFVGIQWGIILGALFTLVLIIKKSAKPNIAQLGYVANEKSFRDISRYPEAITANEVVLLRIDSSLHFANISFLEEEVKHLLNRKTTQWLILDMSGVNDIDTISIQRLEEIIHSFQQRGVTVLFAHMKGSVRDTVNKLGWQEKYKEQQNHLSIDQLLKEKGIRSYFDPSYQYVSATKEWNNNFII